MPIKEKYKRILQKQRTLVSSTDVAQIKEEAESARKLLESPDFLFFRDYLRAIQKSITELFVQNRIKAVHESTTDEQGVTKQFDTTKEEQMNELSGQYKLIETIMQDLKNFADLPAELEKAKETGSIDVVDSQEG